MIIHKKRTVHHKTNITKYNDKTQIQVVKIYANNHSEGFLTDTVSTYRVYVVLELVDTFGILILYLEAK